MKKKTTKMEKAFTEYTDRELLKLFAKTFDDYDWALFDRDDFLENNPNRGKWTKDDWAAYDGIFDEIVELGTKLNELTEYVNNLK